MLYTNGDAAFHLAGKTIATASYQDLGYCVSLVLEFTDHTSVIIHRDRGDEFSDNEFEVSYRDDNFIKKIP